MKVIIPRIPQTTSRNDLLRLAAELLSHRLRLPFTAPPRVTDCEILHITDSRGSTERHGVIHIDSGAAGRWLIQRIQGRRLHNKMIFARRFVNRRDKGAAFHPLYDRRRSDLKITKADVPSNPREGAEIITLAYRSAAGA